MKKVIKSIFRIAGFELNKVHKAGSHQRPVGYMDLLLEDLKARGLTCQATLDVGAHKAVWSRLARKVFPESTSYLIEPQIEMKEWLDAFCNEFEGSVYFMAGAGAKSDLLTLTVWEDLAGSSFLTVPKEELKDRNQREIEIVAIDDLIASGQIVVPELIKLDIQGFELEALKGASKTFGHTEVFIMEVSLYPFMPDMPVFSDIVHFMSERGYVVYDLPGFSRRPYDGALAQCDICFVKRDGFLRKSCAWD